MTRLASCYIPTGSETVDHQFEFEGHEWQKHGKCAGVENASSFFAQACDLARAPLGVLAGARAAGLDLADAADQLQRSGYCVWKTMSHEQVLLSACAGDDGKWKLADAKAFPEVCRWHQPSPGPAPAPLPMGACIKGKRGPP